MASISEIAALSGLSPSTVSLVLRKKPPYSHEAEKKVRDAVAALEANGSAPAVTIRDVAAHAGVSIASVSNVLNGYPVSAALRDNVLRSIEALGYTGSASRPHRAGALTILLLDNNADLNTTGGICSHLRSAGCKYLQMNWEIHTTAEVLAAIAAYNISGVIFCNCENVEMVRAVSAKVPALQCGYFIDADCCSVVCPDFQRAACDMATHIFQSGKRSLLMVHTEHPDGIFAQNTDAGLFQAAMRCGIPAGNIRFRHLEFARCWTHEGQVAFLKDALHPEDGAPPVDAFLFSDGSIAVAHLFLLQQMGYRVPEQVAVAGLSSSLFMNICEPKLTYITHSCIEIGIEAAKQILDMISNPGEQPRQMLFRSRLAAQGSVCAAAQEEEKA